ncbi:hypothetical protein [uncultured Tateyamaria sp.]|uniref:hypothetical protein n=1 Tax=uncultured Tateyamaria sp. TaxID=455651 RepID=UPI00262A0287|nr:hypothetical protein [uncultured Tateyamaria sp.]
MIEDSYAACMIAARAELMSARRLLGQEIRSYPTPISGCDAQFNHLLAERTRVTEALEQLNASVFIPTPRMPSADSRIESR